MKTNKSLAKRVKITKNGKILVRKGGQNHFNAKESRSKQLNKKNWNSLELSTKNKSRYLANQF